MSIIKYVKLQFDPSKLSQSNCLNHLKWTCSFSGRSIVAKRFNLSNPFIRKPWYSNNILYSDFYIDFDMNVWCLTTRSTPYIMSTPISVLLLILITSWLCQIILCFSLSSMVSFNPVLLVATDYSRICYFSL